MESKKPDTCEMCHRVEFENPTMEKWSCYTLCTKCSDSVSEYISENIHCSCNDRCPEEDQ